MPADNTHIQYLDRLGAHIDGELSAADAADVAAHLATCEACSAEYRHLLRTVESMHQQLPPLRAPDALRARVEATIRTPARALNYPVPASPRNGLYRLLTAAAVMALMLGAAYGIGARSAANASEQMTDAVLTAHIRSLQQGHLTDVISTDQHTVKPWFTGKIDFSPAVPRLEADSFPLVGGRLDYVGDHAAAAIVYHRRGHIINVLTYPSADEGDIAPRLESRRGFQIAHWAARGMTYWVVSDLNADELRTFCALTRAADAAR